MIDTEKYDFEEALKYVQFVIFNSIVQYEKAGASQALILEFKNANHYIIKVMEIMNMEVN